MSDVQQLLQKVIELIHKDVTAIESMSKFGDKLPHTVSADLVDYSRALLNLASNVEAKNKDEQRRLSKMTTEELLELARPVIDAKK